MVPCKFILKQIFCPQIITSHLSFGPFLILVSSFLDLILFLMSFCLSLLHVGFVCQNYTHQLKNTLQLSKPVLCCAFQLNLHIIFIGHLHATPRRRKKRKVKFTQFPKIVMWFDVFFSPLNCLLFMPPQTKRDNSDEVCRDTLKKGW